MRAAGWYADPGREFDHRYWDGEGWTDGVSRNGVVSESPLPPDERAAWPVRAAVAGVVAVFLSLVVASIALGIGAAAGFDGDVTELALAELGFYGGLLFSCWLISRRWGSGRFVADFGLAFRRRDWLRGLGFSLVARIASVVAALIFVAWSEDFAGSNTEVFEDYRSDVAMMTLLVVSALVAAPLVEELFFRGLLLRAFELAMPVPVAVGVQALLFGLAHTSVDIGPGNVSVIAATAAAGAVFGFLAVRYRRLGPSIAAHAWFNVVPVVFVLVVE